MEEGYSWGAREEVGQTGERMAEGGGFCFSQSSQPPSWLDLWFTLS